jgi:hypothetical protein
MLHEDLKWDIVGENWSTTFLTVRIIVRQRRIDFGKKETSLELKQTINWIKNPTNEPVSLHIQ